MCSSLFSPSSERPSLLVPVPCPPERLHLPPGDSVPVPRLVEFLSPAPRGRRGFGPYPTVPAISVQGLTLCTSQLSPECPLWLCPYVGVSGPSRPQNVSGMCSPDPPPKLRAPGEGGGARGVRLSGGSLCAHSSCAAPTEPHSELSKLAVGQIAHRPPWASPTLPRRARRVARGPYPIRR